MYLELSWRKQHLAVLRYLQFAVRNLPTEVQRRILCSWKIHGVDDINSPIHNCARKKILRLSDVKFLLAFSLSSSLSFWDIVVLRLVTISSFKSNQMFFLLLLFRHNHQNAGYQRRRKLERWPELWQSWHCIPKFLSRYRFHTLSLSKCRPPENTSQINPLFNIIFEKSYINEIAFCLLILVVSISFLSVLCCMLCPKAWFPYRRICRVCRTKKIHRTDRIHSISYNTFYLSFLFYWAVVQEVSIKLYLSYEFFYVRQIRQIQRYGNQA